MAAHQAPLSLGFSRQEYWSGVPFPSPMHESEKWQWSLSVVSDSLRPHGLQPTRLLRPWDFFRQEYWSGVLSPLECVFKINLIYVWGFPGSSDVGNLGLNPGSGRSPGEGNDYPLQYSCLENPMDRGTWWAIIHGITKSQMWVSNEHFHFFNVCPTNRLYLLPCRAMQ